MRFRLYSNYITDKSTTMLQYYDRHRHYYIAENLKTRLAKPTTTPSSQGQFIFSQKSSLNCKTNFHNALERTLNKAQKHILFLPKKSVSHSRKRHGIIFTVVGQLSGVPKQEKACNLTYVFLERLAD